MNKSWNKEAKTYILSEKINKPINIKVTPEIIFECFCIDLKDLLLKFTFDVANGISINGTAKPNE